jgi:hypothetical protein
MLMENFVQRRLAGETEVLGKSLPQRHVVHHKSHMTRPEFEPGRRGGNPATNLLSYGAASNIYLVLYMCWLLVHGIDVTKHIPTQEN